ncbi:MAG: sugar transferase [candidate division WOR-3 bacterium]
MSNYFILWLLLIFFSYIFGVFNPKAGGYYGFNIKTQIIFVATIISQIIILFLIKLNWVFDIKVYLAIWLFLNLLAPIIGLALRRLLPISIVLISDKEQTENNVRCLGFKVSKKIPKDEAAEWLQRNADSFGRLNNANLILVDMTNPVPTSHLKHWIEQFFVDFISIRSFKASDCLCGLDISELDYPRFGIQNRYQSGIGYRLKRIIDIVVCLIVLILIAPLFLFMVLCIKLDSSGPVFYRHHRLGKNMKPFNLLKLRTMYQDADKRLQAILQSDPKLKDEFEKTFKLKNDPRVTKTGKIIRKLSLDELPQIFNVIRGEMSLVGPRPIVEAEVLNYQKYSLDLFRVLPGMTGLWQTSGRTETSYEQRIKLDTHYVRTWSLKNDLKMLFKTIPVVISKHGAY